MRAALKEFAAIIKLDQHVQSCQIWNNTVKCYTTDLCCNGSWLDMWKSSILTNPVFILYVCAEYFISNLCPDEKIILDLAGRHFLLTILLWLYFWQLNRLISESSQTYHIWCVRIFIGYDHCRFTKLYKSDSSCTY